MQIRNREVENFVGNEYWLEGMDFPTEEELLAALDASLEQAPWLPHSMPLAVDATSRHLAQHWHEVMTTPPALPASRGDDHYVNDLYLNEMTTSGGKAEIEPEFLVEFIHFLTHRITQRMNELRQAQHLLGNELAYLQPDILELPL